MLFHIKQSHAPQDCPYGRGGSTSLFDRESKDVTVHGYWLAFPQHTTYLVVETDDHAPPGLPEAGGRRHHLRDHPRRRSPSAPSRLGADVP